jgi:BirA family biotin operon repressor/biotin-[acetyl-CoA-carboxylase] ligase
LELMNFPVLTFDELDSTNSEAARRASAGECGPVWLTARRQTAGRGRQGRIWRGASENLAATLLLTTEKPPMLAAQIAFVAALAAADLAAAFTAPAAVTLKWPNDVLVGGAKACGVLVESGAAPGGGLWLAVGVGANLASFPTDTPYPATSFSAHGVKPTPDVALEALDDAFAHWLATWEEQGFEPLRAAWLDRAHGLGQPAFVTLGTEPTTGVIEGMDVDGALLLRVETGTLKRITAGDIIFGGV